jgi:hypothetical protein
MLPVALGPRKRIAMLFYWEAKVKEIKGKVFPLSPMIGAGHIV